MFFGFFFKSSIHRIWLNIISLTRGFVFFSCGLIRRISRLVRQARGTGIFSIQDLHRVYTDEKYSIDEINNRLTVAPYMLNNVQCDMYLFKEYRPSDECDNLFMKIHWVSNKNSEH